MGDIAGLAESLKKYGLLHPIIVDEDINLIAGQRRLEAAKSLGWTDIDVKYKKDLTESEKREIELEENLRRKDLTELEQSKSRRELAKRVGERLARESFSKTILPKPQGGRPDKPNSLPNIAKEMGVTKQTLINDDQHVAAVEQYPALEPIPKMQAIQTAKQLNALPPEEREKAVKDILSRPDIKGDISFMLEPGYVPPSERVKRDVFLRLGNVFYKFSVIVNGVTQWKGMEEAAGDEEFESLVSAYNSIQSIQEKLDAWTKIIFKEINERKNIRRVK
jgi:hypothetical protein